MTLPSWLPDAIRSQYNELGWGNHPEFVRWVRSIAASGTITTEDADDVLSRFPDPHPVRPEDWQDEGDAEAYLLDPPDPGPLAGLQDHGWIDEESGASLRLTGEQLRLLIGLKDREVLADIQENALHILGRCNNPKDWGVNRQGLVYGMVQSGKTACMISLIALARRAGFRLFIILAGDKSSLREQTQSRIDRAFDLTNGLNLSTLVHSPTWSGDFGQLTTGYSQNFRYADRIVRGQDWSTIIVVKKQTNNLHELINQLLGLRGAMEVEKSDFGRRFGAIILDDEADYASQNTDVYGLGNVIHNDVVALREALPRNSYVGFTATPQACFSADPNDQVGYPRDFFWLLEPFMDRTNGIFRTRTYLGAWEVFWIYDTWLLHRMARDEWPHHEKDARGRSLGIYVPAKTPGTTGTYTDELRLVEVENQYLQEVLSGARPRLSSLTMALIDFVIGCGLSWWREWRRENRAGFPSIERIESEYPYHAAMVHLSVTQENQDLIRSLVQRQWDDVVRIKHEYDPGSSPPDNPFRIRWELQLNRSAAFLRSEPLPYDQISWFIDRCIEITARPILDHRQMPYAPYPGSPFVYLLNRSDDGMELFYGPDVDKEVRTKRSAIVVGGNILSRGLTIEGLSVTVFGRMAQMPMGDTTLQMGRWFGHKISSIDTVSIYLQDGTRHILRQIAEADRYLRLQIKDALIHGHSPMEVLLEMRNSPFFRSTSPSKSSFLKNDGGGMGFSGRVALLNEPSFEPSDIAENLRVLKEFVDEVPSVEVYGRARLFRDVAPARLLRLLRSFICPDDASQTSFGKFADYLEAWLNGDNLPPFPRVNVAVMLNPSMQRRRVTTISRPQSVEEARRSVTNRFGSIVGGRADDGRYKGDAFLDKPPEWHLGNESPPRERPAGDPILIAFYRLDPNYISKTLWTPGRDSNSDNLGSWRSAKVELEPEDSNFVSWPGIPKGEFSVITFSAWTPLGGPMYDIQTNMLIDPARVRQRGRVQVEEDARST